MSNDRKYVVLVADDEPSTLALLGRHLRARGYTVLEANDGDEAWELAHEHLPHLVILDVMMPGMSGWEVCRKIREAVSLAHTGVIMLTGIGEALNEMTSPLYGADAHVDKPFEFADLDAKISQTLEQRQAGTLGRPDAAEEIRLAVRPRRPAAEETTVRLPLPRPIRAKKAPTKAALPATKPEKAKPAPKAKPVKAKLAPKAEVAPAAQAKPVVKAVPAAKAKPVAKTKPAAKTKAKVKANPAAKTKAKAKPVAKAKSVAKAKPAVKAKPVAKTKAKAKPIATAKLAAKTKTKAKAKPVVTTKPAAKGKAAPKPAAAKRSLPKVAKTPAKAARKPPAKRSGKR